MSHAVGEGVKGELSMWVDRLEDYLKPNSAAESKDVTEILLHCLRLVAPPEERYTLGVLIDMAVDRLWVNANSSFAADLEELPHLPGNPFQAARRKVYVKESTIGGGKTRLGHGIESCFEASGINVASLPEDFVPEVNALFYSDMAKYAYASQLFFTRTRKNANSIAQAHVGRIPSLHPNHRQANAVALVDRSSIGDILFAILNYLDGRMNNKEILAVLAAMSNEFHFDGICYLDVSAHRAEFVTKSMRKRPGEQGIPLAYFEGLRMAHYAMMRALALKGAPVLYTYCDDTPLADLTKDNHAVIAKRLPFLDPTQVALALINVPHGEDVKRLWSNTLSPVYGVTTEEEVAAACKLIGVRYRSSPNLHGSVRNVAYVAERKSSGAQ